MINSIIINIPILIDFAIIYEVWQLNNRTGAKKHFIYYYLKNFLLLYVLLGDPYTALYGFSIVGSNAGSPLPLGCWVPPSLSLLLPLHSEILSPLALILLLEIKSSHRRPGRASRVGGSTLWFCVSRKTPSQTTRNVMVHCLGGASKNCSSTVRAFASLVRHFL